MNGKEKKKKTERVSHHSLAGGRYERGMVPPATLKALLSQPPSRVPPHEIEERLDRLPRVLCDALYPFQLEGVRFGLARNGRCLIADQMVGPVGLPNAPPQHTHAHPLPHPTELVRGFGPNANNETSK